jgi:hypothetical protein
MRKKKCKPPQLVLASDRGRDSRVQQHYGAADAGRQDLKSKTPTEKVHIFAIWEDFLPPEHGWFWSLGDDHSPVAGPFACREDAVRHAKLLISPTP